MWIRRLIHCIKSAYYVTSFLTISLLLFFSDSYHMARFFVELELFFCCCCAFHIFNFVFLCFVLTLRRPSTSLPSRKSLRTTSRRVDSVIGSRYSITTSSVSGQLRNWFPTLPFPASCGTGSGHSRFRPVSEFVPATSVSGQFRNLFRPLQFPASCGTGCRHDLDFP
jgi:hypothetical protein